MKLVACRQYLQIPGFFLSSKYVIIVIRYLLKKIHNVSKWNILQQYQYMLPFRIQMLLIHSKQFIV